MTHVMYRPRAVLVTVSRLRWLGIGVALDDLGTG